MATFCNILQHLQNVCCQFSQKLLIFQTDFLQNFEIATVQKYAKLVDLENAVNAYFLAKFRFDTAENEPAKNLQNFEKNAKFVYFANSANLLILLTS